MIDPVAMGYDPLSAVGERQRKNLAAALLAATDCAPAGARGALWIDAAQVALLWLRGPTPGNTDAAREILTAVREKAPALADDSDEGALANAVRWVLEMIAFTRFGPAQEEANRVALRAVMGEAGYLDAASGGRVDMLVGHGRALQRYRHHGGDLVAWMRS